MRKLSKPEGKVREEGSGIQEEGGRISGEGLSKKKCKRHEWHLKTNLHTKFYPNRTMVKGRRAEFREGG